MIPASIRPVPRSGSALIFVLLALALLLSLGVPFLLTGRLRSEAAREGFDRVRARLAVDSASRYARWVEARSHPSEDPTPTWDESAEWDPAAAGVLPQVLGGAWETSHQSWGIDAENLQGRVSLSTASPYLLQNLLHPCYTAAEADFRATELEVNSTAGFPEAGMLLIGGLWVQYGGIQPTAFTGLSPAEDPPDDLTATRFRIGTAVLDPRVWNLVMARLARGPDRPPAFRNDLYGEDPTGSGPLPDADLARLDRLCWFRTGRFGAGPWGPGAWLVRPIDSENPEEARVSDVLGFGDGRVVRFEPEQGDPVDSLVVDARLNGGRLRMIAPLPEDLEVFTTRVRPLLEEPVDLNSAPPEILAALVTGLRWAAMPLLPPDRAEVLSGNPRSDWIRPSQGRAFAARVVQERPLHGMEDLWEQVLAPLAKEGTLTDIEALAVFQQGFAGDTALLAQAGPPFAFRSGDRYLQRVDAALRSGLGRTLARSARREVAWVAPEGPALRLWRTQRDFDDAGRWGRGAHGVVSLPRNLPGFGGDGEPPYGLAARSGLDPSVGILSPSDVEEESFLIPQPARERDGFGRGARGRTDHFDLAESPLGYDVRERGPLSRSLADWGIVSADTVASSVEPLCLEAWFEMPKGLSDSTLLDLSGPTTDAQRVVASLEGGLLKIRARDIAGEDPLDPDGFEEALTVTLDPAEYPLENRWMHLGILLRGVSPGGFQVAVDGVPRGRMNVRTYLTQALPGYAPGSGDDEVFVESTEGFPPRGVLRIGNEVLEYSSKTARSFVTQRTAGAQGYLGGRVAREGNDTLIGAQDSDHPVGAGVELYGYSAVLASDIPPGGSTLSGEIGPFSVAVATGGQDSIEVMSLSGRNFPVGTGLFGDTVGDLDLAAMFDGDATYAQAFQSDGGYALLFQPRTGWIDTNGFRLGGYEVVRYSKRTGTVLTLVERHVQTPGVLLAPEGAFDPVGNSFVTEWNANIVDASGQALTDLPAWRLHVMPISIHGAGVTELTYLRPLPEFSEFVQLNTPGDSSTTEWVRYDNILQGNFLRDDWGAIQRAVGAYVYDENLDLPNVPPGGGSTGGGGFRTPWQDPGPQSFQFVRTLGEPPSDRGDALELIRQRFDFRGVLHTYDHAHAIGTQLVPVFQTWRGNGPWNGYVGRLDRVAVLDDSSRGVITPQWFTVEWGSPAADLNRVRPQVTYVAFTVSPAQPWAQAPPGSYDLNDPSFDPRTVTRLVKFPSGERPYELENLTLGGSVGGGSPPFPGHIDEVSIHTTTGLGPPNATPARGAFVLAEDLPSDSLGDIVLDPYPLVVETHRKYSPDAGSWLGLLPQDGGLLDIDGERIAYDQVDAAAGRLRIAPNGRGLHGTQPRGHAAGTTVWVVDGRPTTVLSHDVAAGEPLLSVKGLDGFPARPLLLIDRELVQAPLRGLGNSGFLMPTFRPHPERGEDGGDGILRGRFGTTPASHGQGTLVYGMPTRWLDRYVPRSDSPAGAWYQFSLEEPGAFWRGLRFDAEVQDSSQKVRILARAADADWEGEPGTTPGLLLLDGGAGSDGLVPLGLRADHLDLRLSFDWDAGAFDPVDFLSTGWLRAPRVRDLLIDYLAESRIERTVEVRE